MDILQFPCPACDKRLRVPSSAAGQRGPCPNCGEEIIGPQPALGIPARISLHPGPPLNEIPLPPNPRPPKPEPSGSTTVSEALEVFQPKDVVPKTDPPEVPEEEPRPSAPPPIAATEPSSIDDEPARRIRRLWAAVFVLSCILCTVLAFIGGYLTALKRAEIAAPIFAAPSLKTAPVILPADLPPASPVESDDASSEPPVEEAPSTVDPPPSPDSRATLEAFLSAPDWTSRSAYVAEKSHAAMKAAAEEEGDGSIEVTSIEPTLLDGDLHHYQLTTARLPKGFPVTLRESPNGWQIDWPSFHEFSTDRFGRFLAGEFGETGQFRLFLKPAEDSQPAFAAYQLTSPVGDHTTLSYAPRSGPVHAQLTALLDSEEVLQDPKHQALLARGGLPTVLEITRKTSSDGQPYVELDRMVAVGWGAG